MRNRRYRIVWSSRATGTEETVAVCNTKAEAERIARAMLGEPVTFDGRLVIRWR